MGLKIADIIKQARADKSQREFSILLKKSQGQISKYEKGEVQPPSKVIEQCIDMINLQPQQIGISSDKLALRIRKELKDSEFYNVRGAILTMLDNLK